MNDRTIGLLGSSWAIIVFMVYMKILFIQRPKPGLLNKTRLSFLKSAAITDREKINERNENNEK